MNELGGPIGQVCKRLGLIPIRVQTGEHRVRGGYLHCAEKGTPDWLVLGPNGQCLWLESKVEGKQLSKGQQDFARRAARLGHVVERVVTEADVVRVVKANFVGV